ncbi:alpha-(1,3)-fucosyltransferase C-like [Argopecten irradians]|uniref:alpha-(1,3)-fucosyltransferase C-like n=1 Tax=Argopecten irradians TaxID=31199 RepID=UPI00371321F9
MNCVISKRQKKTTGVIIISLVIYWILTNKLENIPRLHFSSQQVVRQDVNESIPIYFYRKQSDLSNPFRNCKSKCHLVDGMSNKDNDVVVFHAPTLYENSPLKKFRGQLWVYHSMEPPTYHPESDKMQRWRNLFNWTLSYRRDADILHMYGRFHSIPVNKQKQIETLSTWSSQLNKSIIFVSNCPTAGRRMEYIEVLNPLYDTDVYGDCGKFVCPKSEFGNCLNKLNNYKFALAFENSICRDYVTEKMFKAYRIQTSTIPIGRGQTQYDIFLPPKSYLDTSTYPTTKDLTAHMWNLSTNITAASSYFWWKRNYVSDQAMSEGFCELCRRVHDPQLKRKYTGLYRDIDAWLRGSEAYNFCRIPTDLALYVKKTNFVQNLMEILFGRT